MDTENNVVMNDQQVQVMDIPEVQEAQVQPEVVTEYVSVPTVNKAACAACAAGGLAVGIGGTLGLIYLIKKVFKKEDPKPVEEPTDEEE